MNPRFAQIISVIFHPLLMATWLLLGLCWVAPASINVDALSVEARGYVLGFVFMTTFVVPALLTYYLYRFGVVGSMQLNTLAERRKPYILTVFCYVVATYFFTNKTTPVAQVAPMIGVLLKSITLALLLVAIISLKWKISAHSVGVGGVLGILCMLFITKKTEEVQYLIIAFLAISGFVMSARLALNAHTPKQVYAGFGLGFLVNVAMGWFL